jgi:TolA-binding protein
MRKSLIVPLLALVLAACGGDKAATAKIGELESRNEELNQRIAKLEKRLDESEKQLVQQQQAMQTISDRLKTAEVGIDKLAYGAAAPR